MVVCTITKKKLMRIIITALAVLTGAGIAVWAILSALTASAQERELPVYCVDRGDNKIAITFDCAWGNSNTEELLSALKAADAKATFFVTGEFCGKYPEDVKKMWVAGHEIGNHSDSHPHIEGININDLIADTNECSRKIKMITGSEPTLYRGPYGEYDDISITTIRGMGMQYVQWSVDSIDWEDPDPATIVSRIMDGAQSGSILLFHNDLENTMEALPQILTALKQKGFQFVTVSDILYQDNYYIDSTGKQIYQLKSQSTLNYSNNADLNAAMEAIRGSLTLDEIYRLAGASDVAVIEKAGSVLTEAQLYAVQNASYEELKEAMSVLISRAETEGAGGVLKSNDVSDSEETSQENIQDSGNQPPEETQETGDDTVTSEEEKDPPDETTQPEETTPGVILMPEITTTERLENWEK